MLEQQKFWGPDSKIAGVSCDTRTAFECLIQIPLVRKAGHHPAPVVLQTIGKSLKRLSAHPPPLKREKTLWRLAGWTMACFLIYFPFSNASSPSAGTFLVPGCTNRIGGHDHRDESD